MIQPRLTFENTKHIYKWDGRIVPSVTHILQSVGVKKDDMWKPIGYDNSFLKNEIASDFGIAFHAVAAIMLWGKEASFPESMTPWINQFKRFLNANPLSPVQDCNGNPIIEYPMYSQQYGYAGTLDLLAKCHGEFILFDWKTSTVNQDHWNLQTAAYAQLAKEILKIKNKIICRTVRFSENSYMAKTRKDHYEDFIKFQSTLNVYKMAA